jgi:hypothetical protein
MFFEKFIFTLRDSFAEANKTQLFIKEEKHIVINSVPSTWHTDREKKKKRMTWKS